MTDSRDDVQNICDIYDEDISEVMTYQKLRHIRRYVTDSGDEDISEVM